MLWDSPSHTVVSSSTPRNGGLSGKRSLGEGSVVRGHQHQAPIQGSMVMCGNNTGCVMDGFAKMTMTQNMYRQGNKGEAEEEPQECHGGV